MPFEFCILSSHERYYLFDTIKFIEKKLPSDRVSEAPSVFGFTVHAEFGGAAEMSLRPIHLASRSRVSGSFTKCV